MMLQRSYGKILFMTLAIALLLGGGYFLLNQEFVVEEETAISVVENENENEEERQKILVVAENLDIPWEIVFLLSGDPASGGASMLVTERSGRLVKFAGGTRQSFVVGGVTPVGEGGLLGLAIHPDYISNNFIYLYFTVREGENLTNRVVRYIFDGESLLENKVIISGIPGGINHNGGRIAFGPDNLLYITTGESGKENLAQERSSLAGKILRVNDDGSVPQNNPFGNEVYSYGHRNPQGLAWDSRGRLWSTEHGRSGISSGYDEINLIVRGGNYGWPVIQGGESASGMISPVIHSGATTTWAPAGLAYKDGKLFWTGLRGRTLYQADITPAGALVNLTEHFKDEFGRLRALQTDSEGLLYVSTSNTDGRGRAKTDDDRVIRLIPE